MSLFRSDSAHAKSSGKVKYAVVGLGHIAQVAVLPAFKNAENAELTALVSDDPEKLKELSEEYGVEHTYSYDEFEQCKAAGVQAVYIALPNNLHCEYTVRAARAGLHVLCEKPMAVTEDECQQMIAAVNENGVKLMIAYRLHFEEANLKAIEIVNSGEIGEPRIFNSVFTLPVKAGDIRVKRDLGGGTLYDIGVYCINAARYSFRAEPTEVFAYSVGGKQPHLREVDEMTSATLKFPDGRLASFTTSFGVDNVGHYRVLGTKGDLLVDPAYSYAAKLTHQLTIDGQTKKTSFSQRDHFGPELVYFSQCILDNQEPEPSGHEGLLDVQIVRAVYQSADTGLPVKLSLKPRDRRPTMDQHIKRKAISKPELVNVESPTGGT